MINKTKIRRKLVKLIYKLGLAGGKFRDAKVLSSILEKAIREKTPLSVGRLGMSEINAYLIFNNDKHPKWTKLDYKAIRKGMLINVGFYPDDDNYYQEWAAEYVQLIQECDLFSVYYNKVECYFFKRYMKKKFMMSNSALVHPMLDDIHWMDACKGKKILVITSSVETIKTQLSKKDEIWAGSGFELPDAEYMIIKSPFSPLVDPSNTTESSAVMMEQLKEKINDSDCDILLAAAGGYSNPLVVYAKSIGKVGINMGGAIDPLFGIKTKRYAEGNNRMPNTFMNEHWISPLDIDRPENAGKVEDGCYW